MVRDLALALLVAGMLIAVIVGAVRYRLRWNRLYAGYSRLQVHADDLLQDVQGMILNLQGIADELPAGDPIRQRIDQALARADRRLAGIREKMQPLCSVQQQDHIQ